MRRLRTVFEGLPVSRLVRLEDAPGNWVAGAWYGLDLPNSPGTREQRSRLACVGRTISERARLHVRREPRPPVVPEGAAPGRRFWWCPGWLELPLEEEIPLDAWFFPKNAKRYTPDIWFVPHWSESKQPGEHDPDYVQMLWRDGHIAERPGGAQRSQHPKGVTGPSQGGGRRGELCIPRYVLYNVHLERGVLGLDGF